MQLTAFDSPVDGSWRCVESGGRAISKEELMEAPGRTRLDANLTVTMSTLRKALGEKAGDHRAIVTIPGRGYRFVAELQPREVLIVEQHTISELVIEDGPDSANNESCAKILLRC